jgi:hypothetical protein
MITVVGADRKEIDQFGHKVTSDICTKDIGISIQKIGAFNASSLLEESKREKHLGILGNISGQTQIDGAEGRIIASMFWVVKRSKHRAGGDIQTGSGRHDGESHAPPSRSALTTAKEWPSPESAT